MNDIQRIDIHEPIYELCKSLSLKPEFVAEIIFRPSEVVATVFEADATGSKYIDPATGGVAKSTRTIKVST